MRVKIENTFLSFDDQDTDEFGHLPQGVHSEKSGLEVTYTESTESDVHILSTEEQRAIVGMLRGEDEDLAEEAFTRARASLLSRCRHLVSGILGECYLVDDVVNDCLVRALWEKRTALKPDTKLATYLLYCMRNAAIAESMKLKGRATDYVAPLVTDDTHPSDRAYQYHSVPSSADPTREVESAELLQQVLSVLTDKERELVLMKHGQDLSYTEISERLGIKVTTLRRRMNIAMSKMRDKVESDFAEPAFGTA